MDKIEKRISRSPGIVVDGGYIVGGGYRGFTQALDDIVAQEAEILRAHFNTDVTIRFNSDRLSGGAWLVDSEEGRLLSNCAIGLGASLYNSKLRAMPLEESMKFSVWEIQRLRRQADKISYTTAIDLKKTVHSVPYDSKYIVCDSEYRDFSTLEEAVEYLFSHVTGLKAV